VGEMLTPIVRAMGQELWLFAVFCG
jgi:hypothetical protein